MASDQLHVAGREAELAALQRFLDGPPSALVLEGPAGIGKSTLWDVAVERWPHRLLLSRPARPDSELPFVVVGDLLRGLDPRDLLGLPLPQREAIDVALRRAAGVSEDLDQHAVGLALLHVLDRLGSDQRVLVAVDDVQWADASSVRALGFALRRAAGSASLLVTRRTGAASEHGEIDAALPAIERLEVGPLSVEALETVIRQRFGPVFLLPAIAELHRASGGNPFLALEIARIMRDRNIEVGLGSGVPVPTGIADVLQERLAGLSTETLELLAGIAVSAAPTIELLATDGSWEEVRRALDEVRSRDIVDSDGDRLAFTHPLFADAVLSRLGPRRTAAVHLRLAERTSGIERARHLAAGTGSPDPAVAEEVAAAAAAARRGGAPDEAARLYRRAFELTPLERVAELQERARRSAQAFDDAGDLRQAEEVAAAAVEASAAGPERMETSLLLAGIRFSRAGVEAAQPLWDEILREADADLRAEVLAGLAWSRMVEGELHAAVLLSDEALVTARSPGVSEQRRCYAEAAAATIGFFATGESHLDRVDRCLDRAAEAASQERLAPLTLMFGISLTAWSLDVDRARSLLDVWAAAARSGGDRNSAATVRWYEGLLHLLRGRPDAASAAMLPTDRAAYFGSEPNRYPDQWLEGATAVQLGRLEEARSHAESLRDGPVRFQINAGMILGLAAYLDGDLDEAARWLEPLPARTRELGWGAPTTLRYLADLFDVQLLRGRFTEAQSVLAELDELASRTSDPWAVAVHRSCSARLLAATGAEEAAEDEMEQAVKLHRELDNPLELGRCLLAAGTMHRRRKRKAPARAALEEAARLFASVGADGWRRLADEELARVGGRPSTPTELTPTEARVAELVAAGRSNREVADALFVSIKTVEWNLSKVYRKLGIRSRAELAGTWSDAVSGPTSDGGPG